MVAAGTRPPQSKQHTNGGGGAPLDLRRISEHDADYTRLHARTTRLLTASLRQLVRDLRHSASHDSETPILSAFIARHTNLLRQAYTAAHGEGVRDYYDGVSRQPQHWAKALGQTPQHPTLVRRLSFYAPSVAKLAHEALLAWHEEKRGREMPQVLREAEAIAARAFTATTPRTNESIALSGHQPGYTQNRGPHGRWGPGDGGNAGAGGLRARLAALVAHLQGHRAGASAAATAHSTVLGEGAHVEWGEHEQAGRAAFHAMFGRDLADHEVAALVGARPGDTVRIGHVYQNGRSAAVSLKLRGKDGAYDADRGINTHLDKHGKPDGVVMKNALIQVYDSGKGIGTELFARQVSALRDLGVSEIETRAERGGLQGVGIHGRSAVRNEAFNGYYTWARLGYNADLRGHEFQSYGYRERMPGWVKAAHTIHDLMRIPASEGHESGAHWWQEHGKGWNARFDLTPNSRSIQVLREYLHEKGKTIPGVELTEPHGAEEIEWTAEDEAAADRAWETLNRRWAAEDRSQHLSESITLADEPPLDIWLNGTAPRVDLQAEITWSGFNDGYVDGGATDTANPYLLLYWDLEPLAKHCFPAGVAISVPGGTKPVEQIRIGDLVETLNGPRRVTQLFQNVYHGELARVHAAGREVECTLNHPFLTQRGWIEAGRLLDGDQVVLAQDGGNFLPAHVRFPDTHHGVAASSEFRIRRAISPYLRCLAFCQRLEARVPMPEVSISLDHQRANADVHQVSLVNQRSRLENYSKIGQCFTQEPLQGVRLLQFSSLFRRLQFCHLRRVFFGMRLPPLFNLLSHLWPLHWIVSKHVRLSRSMDEVSLGVGVEMHAQFVRTTSHGFDRQIKHLRDCNRTVRRIVLAQIGDVFRGPHGVAAGMMTASAFAPVASGAQRNGAIANVTALGANLRFTRSFRWPENNGGQVPIATRHAAESAHLTANVTLLEHGSALLTRELSQHSCTPVLGPTVPQETTVYNFEVEGVHHYIANGFVVHNCADCPPYAAGSPYDPPWVQGGNQLNATPGDGHTECGAACKCSLRYGGQEEGAGGPDPRGDVWDSPNAPPAPPGPDGQPGKWPNIAAVDDIAELPTAQQEALQAGLDAYRSAAARWEAIRGALPALPDMFAASDGANWPAWEALSPAQQVALRAVFEAMASYDVVAGSPNQEDLAAATAGDEAALTRIQSQLEGMADHLDDFVSELNQAADQDWQDLFNKGPWKMFWWQLQQDFEAVLDWFYNRTPPKLSEPDGGGVELSGHEPGYTQNRGPHGRWGLGDGGESASGGGGGGGGGRTPGVMSKSMRRRGHPPNTPEQAAAYKQRQRQSSDARRARLRQERIARMTPDEKAAYEDRLTKYAAGKARKAASTPEQEKQHQREYNAAHMRASREAERANLSPEEQAVPVPHVKFGAPGATEALTHYRLQLRAARAQYKARMEREHASARARITELRTQHTAVRAKLAATTHEAEQATLRDHLRGIVAEHNKLVTWIKENPIPTELREPPELLEPPLDVGAMLNEIGIGIEIGALVDSSNARLYTDLEHLDQMTEDSQ